MVYEKLIKGIFISLRSVEEKDAETILNWRTNENISKYLHKVENDVEKQKKWIREQQNREGDYYFLILDKKNNPVGTIGLYNINYQKAEAEFGRWISLSPIFALESCILIYEFGFENLYLNRIISRNVSDNIAVINFHKRFGASYVKDNIKEGEFIFTEYEILKDNFKAIKEKNYNILYNFKKGNK